MSNVAETAEQGNGAKHTAGPWAAVKADGARISIHADHQQIADLWPIGGTNHEANAHLIAAAPALLATCIELRTALLMAMKAMASHPEAWDVFCALAERAGITDGLGKRSQEVIDAATATTS